ncbi:MAG: winged helix-turn-helix domain-containing protein, partial [Acidobacteriota bacterium]
MFEANESAGELRKHGVRIKLHTQPFKVLLLLLERPSGIVTREEMRERLWGAETFVDFDHGLNTAVNKIRDALGDSAAVPRY